MNEAVLHNKKRRGRLKTMLKADFRRMFTSRLIYIMLLVCLFVPVLMLVMVTMMEGSVTVDPNTGVETVMEGFDSVWEIISSLSGSSINMDLTTMCNFNLIYFALAVLVCLFVSEDFKSGYAKNIFAIRVKRGEYAASKIIVCSVGGVLMALSFFAGAMIGGAVAGLSFEHEGATVLSIVMCMLAKIFLIAVFVPIFLVVSILAKQKTWLGILGSCMVGMLLFMTIPMMTPLNATAMNVLLCLAGGTVFSVGLGKLGGGLLRRQDLI